MRNGGDKKLIKELWGSHKREKTQEPWHRQGKSLASEGNQGCKITDTRGKGAERCTGPMAGRNHVTGHGQVTGGSTGQENTKMPETI